MSVAVFNAKDGVGKFTILVDLVPWVSECGRALIVTGFVEASMRASVQ
jgi:hypothetical protein